MLYLERAYSFQISCIHAASTRAGRLKLQDLGQRIAVLRGVEVSPRARAGRLQKETEGQGQGKGKGKEERKKEKRKKKKGKGEG